MEDSQGFIIDAKIIICFPIDGESFCAPDGGIHILKQQKFPVCSQDFYDWIKGIYEYLRFWIIIYLYNIYILQRNEVIKGKYFFL